MRSCEAGYEHSARSAAVESLPTGAAKSAVTAGISRRANEPFMQRTPNAYDPKALADFIFFKKLLLLAHLTAILGAGVDDWFTW